MQENNSIIIAMLEELLTISKSQRTEQTVNANVDLTPIKELIENGNNQAEYQRQYEPHHMQVSHFENKESELINGSLGLLDFTSSPDADSQEEADFRRLMQQKPKKKRTRGFKL